MVLPSTYAEVDAPAGARRALRHGEDGGSLDHNGRCLACGGSIPVPETAG